MTWLRKIDKGNLHPGLVAVIDLTLEFLEEAGCPFKVYSGLRTFAEQDELYAKGRTEPGRIITKARGGESMHNYGLAVDLAPLNLETEQTWDVHWPEPGAPGGHVWAELERCLTMAAREIDADQDDGIDYEWGGRWKFRDLPHCQVRFTLGELKAGHFPYCRDVGWLVYAHTSFLRGTPWLTRRVQHLLNMADFSVGQVDGVFGTKSMRALTAFCATAGLPDKPLDLNQEAVAALVRLDHQAISQPRRALANALV